MYYQPYYYPQQQQQQQRPEHNGLINVPNEQQAREWPVGPGVSLTFKDESAPYIYVKAMGMNGFDPPIFEKYRLIKEEDPQRQKQDDAVASLESQLDEVRSGYQSLKNEIEEMKNWMRQPFMSRPSEE